MRDIELLKDLIKFDSSTKEEANELLLYCEKWLLQNGIESRMIENSGYKSLVCSIGSGESTLILNGHLDVVPAKEEQFEPKIEGERLYGRGSADMKAGVYAMMCTLSELKDINLNSRVMLQLVTDEETGGESCSKHLVSLGYRGDFVICGEPTQLNIGVQAKGILQLDLEFSGKSAHGSRPWEGENAIIKAYKAYDKILTLPFVREKSSLYEGPSINLASIKGGEVYNKVPDYCKMCIDIRLLPKQNTEKILEQIMKEVDCKITVHSTGEPVKTNADNSYVLELKKTAENLSKEECILFGQHGSADTRFFSKFNIPAVEFGPCGGNWHGSDEYVILESVDKYIEILKEFAVKFHEVNN